MKIKVCGMKYLDNIKEVASLKPDYMGFIFWEPSKRFFEGTLPQLPIGIKKVGVFVDASHEVVMNMIKLHDLQGVQLHGKESPEYCRQLRVLSGQQLEQSHDTLEIIKVFTIKDEFDFKVLEPYEAVCDYFLFDTKGKLPGGNGYTFDWKLLANYPSEKPYFLSGGIGLEETADIQAFLDTPASKYCQVIDVNSKFELEPGLKNIDKLKDFITEVL